MNTSHPNPVDQPIDNSLAALWSMMLPGLGQLLKGQIMPGLFWAMLVGFGYFGFFWPGLGLHALCILDAAFNKGEGGFKTLRQKMLFGVGVLGLLIYIVIRNF